MSELAVAAGTAVWLGILTSLSPCPLASNLAAISYVGRDVGSPRRVLLAGVLYSLGRALSYVAVAFVVVASLLALPAVSQFLQREMNRVLGPLLVLAGLFLLGWLRLPGGAAPAPAAWSERAARGGPWGALGLGALFALSFCPVSAGLFFGSLLPLAVATHSRLLVPAAYGLGTGLPVVLAAALLAGGSGALARAFHALDRAQRIALRATGAVFILAGLYLIWTHYLAELFA